MNYQLTKFKQSPSSIKRQHLGSIENVIAESVWAFSNVTELINLGAPQQRPEAMLSICIDFHFLFGESLFIIVWYYLPLLVKTSKESAWSSISDSGNLPITLILVGFSKSQGISCEVHASLVTMHWGDLIRRTLAA